MRSFAGALLAAAALLAGACSIFEDGTPRQIFFEMEGENTGLQVRVIYSKNFIAGVDEMGITHVQVFSSDTVLHTLPIDTVINIADEQQWFVQAETLAGDTLAVNVAVDVDDRNLVSRFGGIFPDEPFRYVYVFNQRLTENVDVTF
ncbi:MAG: hypothetical protein F4139_01435 [Gemmatimonadetes bacterium]|nr:hypothetical protein [Gemmatimonadota bacterium]MYA64872.1 hypothetical protein [Gemmatimonadota bacterium]MYB99764.1 hypothetical protein [Gemmatimonadota bacterium]MYH51591.1 hypothetical protein [Gemmatimonadota bacterium]MYI45245.1 hypothetical protein [Gemmatimonadota bacterium]